MATNLSNTSKTFDSEAVGSEPEWGVVLTGDMVSQTRSVSHDEIGGAVMSVNVRRAIGLLIWFQASVLVSQSVPVNVLITTPESTVRTGATVRINVSITNVTAHTIEIEAPQGRSGSAQETNYVTVYDEDGKKLPVRIDSIRLGTRGVMLGSGKSFEDFFMLSDLADLKRPGTYKVQVRHEFWHDNPAINKSTRTLIPSNILTITVTK